MQFGPWTAKLVSGSIAAGPNVWAHSKATNEFADIGPHMRWSYGQLYDNIQGRQMQAWDRGKMGSGHGWSSTWSQKGMNGEGVEWAVWPHSLIAS